MWYIRESAPAETNINQTNELNTKTTASVEALISAPTFDAQAFAAAQKEFAARSAAAQLEKNITLIKTLEALRTSRVLTVREARASEKRALAELTKFNKAAEKFAKDGDVNAFRTETGLYSFGL